MTRTVLITSVGSGVGAAVVRALAYGPARWRVVGINSVALNAAVFACDSVWLAPPTARRTAFEDRLLEVVAAERPALLIPGRDDDVEVVAGLAERLAGYGAAAVVGGPRAVEACNDKRLTAETLRGAGHRFAATAVAGDEIERLIADPGFPLIVKPRRGFGSRGVRVAFDRDELAAALAGGAEMVVQPYLVPDHWGVARAELTSADVALDGSPRPPPELIGEVFLDRGGAALGVQVSRVDTAMGLPRSLEVVDEPAVADAARAAAECLGGLGLIGPCNLAGRRTADGSWTIFEVNARFTGSTAMRAACGFDEVEAAWRHFVEGEARPGCLRVDPALAVCRDIGERVVPRHDIERLARTGSWRAPEPPQRNARRG